MYLLLLSVLDTSRTLEWEICLRKGGENWKSLQTVLIMQTREKCAVAELGAYSTY